MFTQSHNVSALTLYLSNLQYLFHLHILTMTMSQKEMNSPIPTSTTHLILQKSYTIDLELNKIETHLCVTN